MAPVAVVAASLPAKALTLAKVTVAGSKITDVVDQRGFYSSPEVDWTAAGLNIVTSGSITAGAGGIATTGNIAALDLALTGDATVDGDLTVTGTAEVATQLDVAGVLTVTGTSTFTGKVSDGAVIDTTDKGYIFNYLTIPIFCINDI